MQNSQMNQPTTTQDLFSSKLDRIAAFENSFNQANPKHTATAQGYHYVKEPITLNNVQTDKNGHHYKFCNSKRVSVNYEPHVVAYTQDAAISFPVTLQNGNFAMVEVINDGHGGETCSQWAAKFIFENFQNILNTTNCVVNNTRTTETTLSDGYVEPESIDAIDMLFQSLHSESQKPKNQQLIKTSGTTCSIMIYDETDKVVYAANLGDSPMMRFNKACKNNEEVYTCTWESLDQDAASEAEQMRLRKDLTAQLKLPQLAPASSVVSSGTCSRLLSGLMVTGAIGDGAYDFNPYYHGMRGRVINRIPNKYVLSWPSDSVWVHGSDGMHEHLRTDKRGMGPMSCVTTPLYEQVITKENSTNWAKNVAIEMLNAQSKTICEEKQKYNNKSEQETLDWCLNNWDNHHQYVRVPQLETPYEMPVRCMSAPIMC